MRQKLVPISLEGDMRTNLKTIRTVAKKLVWKWIRGFGQCLHLPWRVALALILASAACVILIGGRCLCGWRKRLRFRCVPVSFAGTQFVALLFVRPVLVKTTGAAAAARILWKYGAKLPAKVHQPIPLDQLRGGREALAIQIQAQVEEYYDKTRPTSSKEDA